MGALRQQEEAGRGEGAPGCYGKRNGWQLDLLQLVATKLQVAEVRPILTREHRGMHEKTARECRGGGGAALGEQNRMEV